MLDRITKWDEATKSWIVLDQDLKPTGEVIQTAGDVRTRWSEEHKILYVVDETGHAVSTATVVEKAVEFTAAYCRWMASGFKKRSPERVAELHAICSACEFVNAEKTQCTRCACGIAHEQSLTNKLTWATEPCPLDNPKFKADV